MKNDTVIEPKNTALKKFRPLVTLSKALVILFLIAIVALLVYPAPILRAAFSRIGTQSGISLTFDRAYFYVGDGLCLHVIGLTIERYNHTESNFAFTAESVWMPAMFPDDFRSPVLFVSGLRGSFERVGNIEKASEPTEGTQRFDYLQGLMLTDAVIDFIDMTPEKVFQTTVRIEECNVFRAAFPSLFEPYYLSSVFGQIDSAAFIAVADNEKRVLGFREVPLTLFAPYAPVLDDIFVAGSMNIRIDDLTDETQKKLRIGVVLLPDCQLKPANEILAPAVQAGLRKLDQTSVSDLHDLQRRIEKWKTDVDTLRVEVDRVVQIIDRLKALAPPNVRQEYEKFKSQYDRATADYEEWNGKFTSLVRDLDLEKVRILESTFQHFIRSGTPIEIDLQETDGKWEYDFYETVVRLIEKNYREIFVAEYLPRIQEIRSTLDRLQIR